jgi:succinate-acetate transporter protein
MMRDYNPPPTPAPAPQEPARIGRAADDVASPAPLGLNVLAFATAILGCFYAGFIIPYQGLGVRPAIGAVLFVSGVVLIVAGILEYRRNSLISATIFTSYGSFLAAIGLVFLPNLGILGILLGSGNFNFAMGLFFLCWTIFAAILFVGALKTNMSLAITMGILTVAYLLLTIGNLSSNNVINYIGGWLAIIAALAAWYTGLTTILSASDPNTASRLSLGHRVTPVE